MDPTTFGTLANDLLVANFGDGTIAAFNLETGDFEGYLRDIDTKIISIDGIWGLAFGNGVSLGGANALYFTAGPNNEQDGVFGRITLLQSRSGTAPVQPGTPTTTAQAPSTATARPDAK